MKFFVSLSIVFLFTSFRFPGDWVEFKSEEGKYRILMPRNPEVSAQSIDTKIGPLILNLATYEVGKYKDDNLVYISMYSDYPDTLINSEFKDEILDKFFRGSVDGAVTNVGGKLISEEKIHYQEFPGRKVKIDYQNGLAVITMESILVKSRFYILEVITETKNDDNKSMDKFFKSFEVL